MTPTPTRPRRRWTAALTTLAAAVGLSAALAGPVPAGAAEQAPDEGLVVRYQLDQDAGTQVTDSSGNGRHGTLSGDATWSAGSLQLGGTNGHVRLPNDVMAGLTEITVSLDVNIATDQATPYFIWGLGNTSGTAGNGYLFTTGNAAYRTSIASGNWTTEQTVTQDRALARGVWKTLTYTLDSTGSATLYLDGVQVAQKTDVTLRPGDIGAGATTANYIGRSVYTGDRHLKGRVRAFALYDRSLSAAEVAQLAEPTSTGVLDADHAALSLGETSAVTSDLTLPATGPNGSAITWATSDAGTVESDGTVHRPAFGEPDATATLTATLQHGNLTRTQEFEVTVLADTLDDEAKAQEAVAAVALVHPDDVRGNLALPSAGLHGTSLAWSSDAPEVVTSTGEVTRPAHGEQPVDVVLTVTATKAAATASRDIVVRVRPAPPARDDEAYAFAYFAGEGSADGEKIYFATSKGNDPLDYDELNDGQPVLASDLGEKGLRDPFIIRSPEGDRFYLLATDLKIHGGNNFGNAQERGSLHLMIWESTDLVSWSEQRMVKVSSDFAGNTWAPEAFYDEDAGEYVVYWASALYPTTDTAGRSISTSYQRMMYATTRDFVTFSEPQVWIDVQRGTGRGMIDVTVVKVGDTYHRVVKDEATMTPRQEKSTDLRATVTGSLPTTTSTPGWQLVKAGVGVGQPNPWGGTFTQGEGPTIFPDNRVDGRWYMFIDQPSYHGGQGYLAFRTDDLESGSWTSVPSADLPSSPRHGTVIPVSQAELDAMRAALQPELLIEAVDDVAVTTQPGTAPTLPGTVPATFGDGSTGSVAVDWAQVDPASYAEPGAFTVAGTVRRGSADRPVATVTVADEAPDVVIGSEPDGQQGWWVTSPAEVVITATDDTGVADVETSVDGGPWLTTAGDTATVLVDGEGTHEVRARAHDVSGTPSPVAVGEVRIDTEAPVSRATLAGRTVTIRAADTTSGVAEVEYRLGGETWAPYEGPFAVGAAAVDVEYRAVDRAGTTEAANTLVVPAEGDELVPTAVAALVDRTSVPHGTQVPITVRVTAPDGPPTGSVRAIADGKVLASANLADGRARIVVDTRRLPGTGVHDVVIRYDGDATHRPGEDVVRLAVAAARSSARLRVAAPDASGRGAVARVRVVTDPGGVAVSRVRVVLRRNGAVVRRTSLAVADGRVSWRLPRVRSGRWTVAARVTPSAVLLGSTTKWRVVRR